MRRRTRKSANSPLAKHLVCDNIVPSKDRLPVRNSAGFVLLRFLGIVRQVECFARVRVTDGNTPRQVAKPTEIGPAQNV